MAMLFKLLVNTILVVCFGCSTDSSNHAPKDPEIKKNTNVFQGKIMRSADQGKTWENITNGLPNEVQIMSAHVSEGHAYLGSENAALYVNRNAPVNTWLTENLKEMYIHPTNNKGYTVTNIFSTLSGVYVHVLYDGLYRKQRGSLLWQPIKLPKGMHVVNDMAEDKSGNLFIVGQDGVYVSSDKGVSWKRIYNLGWLRSIVIKESSILISGQGGVYLSENMGATWDKMPVKESVSVFDLSNDNNNFSLQPYGNELLAMRDGSLALRGISGKLQLSKDGGKSWDLHPADLYIKNLEAVSNVVLDGNKIYCSYRKGIICSEDNGITWYSVLENGDLNKNATYSLSISEGMMYCVEVNFGC